MERYNTLSSYLKKTFGHRLLKLSIDGGFSCPNRKNKKGGCKFCSESGSGEFTKKFPTITEQLNSQIEILKNKDTSNEYIAYFQSYTNTFLPVEKLRELYYEAINFKNVKILSIATRADCFNDEIYDLLSEINEKVEVWIELGLQSSNENTRKEMNIGYNLETFKSCVLKLKELNIKTIFHIIFGLPNETEKDFKNTITYTNRFSPFGIKIHSLYIQKDSLLYQDYLNEKLKLLTQKEYIDALITAIENLDPNIIIHRLTGDGDKNKLVAPLWSKDKIKTIGEVNKILKQKNSYQGKNLN
ncbi:MAG: TIGR01212 family radical SAM protein [Peptoniphilaceae bacterium]|uniref:TIGR01212 family radical SAM protein n=1 Tax=Parvimonas sp. TaxID=1944660 RepID=UPI0025E73F37|nr:TIGR01212 family radical SAM protein [Parvimonas sp.]MCI5997530.1 TIGR01212 family radical SAM protein [Parvimonas sp.]MDD7765508.1 TIGR01212 family radical SAM protein [Peptoniphilaceae bacterium]MDY3051049.1 TIGR01212 family radical SAM protein [Parvimonas sp.]